MEFTKETRLALLENGKRDLNRIQQHDDSFKEIYMDGVLKEITEIDGREGSYGIFLHSLALSQNQTLALEEKSSEDFIEQEEDMLKYDVAAGILTKNVGIDSKVILSTAPGIEKVPFPRNERIRASTHIINDKMRIVSHGKAEDMLKKCKFVVVNSKPVKISRKINKIINLTLEGMLDRGLDVYALAIKDVNIKKDSKGVYRYSKDYSLVAFMGI